MKPQKVPSPKDYCFTLNSYKPQNYCKTPMKAFGLLSLSDTVARCALAALILVSTTAKAEPFRQATDGVLGIFEGLRKAFNPKLAELDSLYTSKKFLEAADFLTANAGNFSESDKEKYIKLLQIHVQAEFHQIKKQLESQTITASLDALLASGIEGANLEKRWKNIGPRWF